VICGSSHEQFEGEVADVHIVSVGSVGEAPGGTHALGAIVESNQAGFSATLFSVALGDEEEDHMELAKERPSSDKQFHG
jgi:hypothetical protein